MQSSVVILLITTVAQFTKLQAALPPLPVATQEPVDIKEDSTCKVCCQGPAAVPGVPGVPGGAGPQGPHGLPGFKGGQGIAGIKGDAGDDGAPGTPGPRGAAGETGPVIAGAKGSGGIAGDKGAEGLKGNAGPRGLPGRSVPGDDGLPGLPGRKGDQGPSGVRGIQGDAGQSRHSIHFTVTRTTQFSSTSDSTRLPFEKFVTSSPDTTILDLNTGTFTAPRSGSYVFMFSVLKSSDAENVRLHLNKKETKNEETVVSTVVSVHTVSPGNYDQLSGSAVVELDAGDAVFLTLFGSVYSSWSIKYTSFSGFMI